MKTFREVLPTPVFFQYLNQIICSSNCINYQTFFLSSLSFFVLLSNLNYVLYSVLYNNKYSWFRNNTIFVKKDDSSSKTIIIDEEMSILKIVKMY